MENARTTFRTSLFLAASAAALFSLGVSRAGAEDRNGGPISMIFRQNGKDQPTSEHFHVTEDHGWVRWRNYEDKDPSLESERGKVYEVEEKEIPASSDEQEVDREARWLAKGISLKFDR